MKNHAFKTVLVWIITLSIQVKYMHNHAFSKKVKYESRLSPSRSNIHAKTGQKQSRPLLACQKWAITLSKTGQSRSKMNNQVFSKHVKYEQSRSLKSGQKWIITSSPSMSSIYHHGPSNQVKMNNHVFSKHVKYLPSRPFKSGQNE